MCSKLNYLQVSIFTYYTTTLDEEEPKIPTIVGVEVGTAKLCAESWVRSVGVIDGRFKAMRAMCPKLEHVFRVRRGREEEIRGERSLEPGHVFREPHRLLNRLLLSNMPITVERGFSMKPPLKD